MKKLNFIVIFIWIGFICSISFMEAWVKFQAPGVSLPIGLSIGKLVFAALNRVEWVLAGIIVLNRGFCKPLLAVLIILLVQTVWLLPALNNRADLIIQGMDVPPSNVHYIYILLEFAKVIALFIAGLKFMNQSLQPDNFQNKTLPKHQSK